MWEGKNSRRLYFFFVLRVSEGILRSRWKCLFNNSENIVEHHFLTWTWNKKKLILNFPFLYFIFLYIKSVFFSLLTQTIKNFFFLSFLLLCMNFPNKQVSRRRKMKMNEDEWRRFRRFEWILLFSSCCFASLKMRFYLDRLSSQKLKIFVCRSLSFSDFNLMTWRFCVFF